MRVARVLRTIKSSKGLRALISALLLSLPALANLGGLFVILQFLYSVLGMQLFGNVAWGDYLNADANFCTFGTAFLTMFRCATGESWNGIMHDAMITADTYAPDGPRCSDEAGDCGSWTALPFFISYTVIAAFVMINMIVAVILENFALSRAASTYKLSPKHSEAFIDAWASYDPYATGYIALTDLGGASSKDDMVATAGLLSLLPAPLNVPFMTIQNEQLDVDMHGEERVSFSVVNLTLLHTIYGDDIDSAHDQTLSKFSGDDTLRWRRALVKSAIMLQRAFRRSRNEEGLGEETEGVVSPARRSPSRRSPSSPCDNLGAAGVVEECSTASQKTLADGETAPVRQKQKAAQAKQAATPPKSPKPTAEQLDRMRRSEPARSGSGTPPVSKPQGFFGGLFGKRPTANDESAALM